METHDRRFGITESDAKKALPKLDQADRDTVMDCTAKLQHYLGLGEGAALAVLAAIGAWRPGEQ